MKLPKPKKKVSKSYLKKKADMLFSKHIRSIGVCEMAPFDNVKCGGVLQCAHIIGRANMRLRYDEKNALCLCSGHHVWYTHHPFEWFEKISEHFAPYWEYLKEHKNEIVKVDYYKVIEKFGESTPRKRNIKRK